MRLPSLLLEKVNWRQNRPNKPLATIQNSLGPEILRRRIRLAGLSLSRYFGVVLRGREERM